MPDLRRALMNDALMDYFTENAEKHGYVNMFSFGSSVFLTVIEADMLAAVVAECLPSRIQNFVHLCVVFIQYCFSHT